MLFSILVVVEAFENGFDSVDTREPKLFWGLKLSFGFFLQKDAHSKWWCFLKKKSQLINFLKYKHNILQKAGKWKVKFFLFLTPFSVPGRIRWQFMYYSRHFLWVTVARVRRHARRHTQNLFFLLNGISLPWIPFLTPHLHQLILFRLLLNQNRFIQPVSVNLLTGLERSR